MYILHSLQGQLSGIHVITLFLNSLRLEQTFKLSGSILFHTIGPKILSEPSPLYTDLTLALEKVFAFLVEGPSFIHHRRR